MSWQVSLPGCRANASSCPGPYPFQQLLRTWRTVVEAAGRANLPIVTDITARQPIGGGIGTLVAIPTLIDRVFRHFVTGLVQEGTAIKSEVLDVALSRVALARAVHISDACPQGD